MRIHKEGISTILITLLLFTGLNWLIFNNLGPFWKVILPILLILMVAFILRFFRNPRRILDQNITGIASPADGLVVAVSEEFESEVFQEQCRKISIFMSAHNVHINWVPLSGRVSYYRYHPGKHLLARNPKSSDLNERTSIAIEMDNQDQVLLKQVAGTMARRVVSYLKAGDTVEQGQELGFIKLGSRVDLFVPLSWEIDVVPGTRVSGCQTQLAHWK